MPKFAQHKQEITNHFTWPSPRISEHNLSSYGCCSKSSQRYNYSGFKYRILHF